MPTAAAAPAYAPAPGERETRIPVKGVRKMTAQAMVASARSPRRTSPSSSPSTSPARWSCVERLQGATASSRGVKVSPLLLVAKALLLAVRRNPEINATLGRGGAGDRRQALRQPRHRRGHPARAGRARTSRTPTGCRCASWPRRCSELAATAREGRTQPADMAGGTITITNVGVFGVDAGTPILNPGEAAILCFGAVRDMPWVRRRARSRSRKVTTAGAVVRPPDGRRRSSARSSSPTSPRPRGPRDRPPLVAVALPESTT